MLKVSLGFFAAYSNKEGFDALGKFSIYVNGKRLQS